MYWNAFTFTTHCLFNRVIRIALIAEHHRFRDELVQMCENDSCFVQLYRVKLSCLEMFKTVKNPASVIFLINFYIMFLLLKKIDHNLIRTPWNGIGWGNEVVHNVCSGKRKTLRRLKWIFLGHVTYDYRVV